MNGQSTPLPSYDSIWAPPPPTPASSPPAHPHDQTLISMNVSAPQSEEARAIDDFRLPIGARLKSVEYDVATFQPQHSKDLAAENKRLRTQASNLTAENAECKARAKKLEQDMHGRKAETLRLEDQNLKNWTLADEKMQTFVQELRGVDAALRAWSSQQVGYDDQGTSDTIQDAINMILASIGDLQADQATTDTRDAELKALKAEKRKLLKDRVCMKDESMGYKLAVKEQEDKMCALRLQHEEDAQEKMALIKQVEDLKELEATKPRRDRRHGAPSRGAGRSVQPRILGNQEGARRECG